MVIGDFNLSDMALEIYLFGLQLNLLWEVIPKFYTIVEEDDNEFGQT